MTKRTYKYRGNQQIEDVDGFLREGESYRVPTMISDSAGGQQSTLDALTDKAADLRLDPSARVAARDALTRHYASLAAVPTLVLKYPGLFSADTCEAVLGVPGAAGRDTLEATYAAYEASIRDAWRGR